MARKPWRQYWFYKRYDILCLEGFTPEEAAIIANVRISTPMIRRVRRVRKRQIAGYLNQGYSLKEAVDAVRERYRDSRQEILDWPSFRQMQKSLFRQ